MGMLLLIRSIRSVTFSTTPISKTHFQSGSRCSLNPISVDLLQFAIEKVSFYVKFVCLNITISLESMQTI